MNEKHILLVEDDANVVKSVVYSLEEAGYVVETTVSGRLGVDVALKTHPDLIIADLILPDINGAEMVAEIRQDEEWGKDAKIVVLTNIDEDQIKLKLHSLNVLRYLIKVDNTLKQITQTVNEILGDH
jgi:CheY-like chemotaxis protein